MSRVGEMLIALKQEMDGIRQAIYHLELLEVIRNGRAAKARDQDIQGVQLGQTPWSKSRRGRKFMGPEEREEVSRRMKAYWAAAKATRPEGRKT